MRNKLLCGLSVAIVALMLAVPVYAYSGKANGGNGGLGNGMGTDDRGSNMHVQSYDRGTRTQATGNHEVSVYGTGTGSQFRNVNAYQNGTGATNRSPIYRSQSYETNGYRAAATTTDRNTSWGWLGWLGLLGLFGLRNRNPERNS